MTETTKITMVETSKKNEDALIGKMLTKLSYSYKAEQKEVITITPNGVLMGEHDEGIQKVLLVMAAENDATSKYFALYRSNASLIDERAGNQRSFYGFARQENGIGGSSIAITETEAFFDENRISVELGGESEMLVAVMTEANFQKYKDGQMIDLSEVDWWKPGYSTVSGVRKGDGVYIPMAMSRLVVLQNMGFELSAYYKAVKGKDGFLSFEPGKVVNRVNLASSSGTKIDIAPGAKFVRKQKKAYKVHDEDDLTKTKKVFSDIYVLLNEFGVEVNIEHAQDFTMHTLEELLLPLFALDGKITIAQREQLLHRLATDGIAFMDAVYAKSIGIKLSGMQFRFTPVGKGLMLIVPGLKKLSGMDILLFDGCIKGDIGVYIQNNDMDFSVLNKTRRVEEENTMKISRQILTAIGNKPMFDGLTKSTKKILRSLYNFDEKALKQFIGFCEEALEEETEETIIEIDNMTVELFMTNPTEFLKSAANEKKLVSLLDATAKKLINGRSLYLEDASIKHMAVDPYTILRFMKQGWLSAVRQSDDNVIGVRRNHLIVSILQNNVFSMEHKKAFLGRYPFLQNLEGRIVNDDGLSAFYDFETERYYEKAFAQGYFQGVAIYSLWDMNPEGQSGADFDGDTTVYSTNPVITDNFDNHTLFLDYSLVEQETATGTEIVLVEGCPFSDSKQTELARIVSAEQAEYLEAHDVSYANGKFLFPAVMGADETLKGIFADAMANHSMVNLEGNDIGRFTNIGASVMSLRSYLSDKMAEVGFEMQNMLLAEDFVTLVALNEAYASLKKEMEGYDKLSILIACAIRWEIDKAKHGGAYRSHLPFLEIFDGFKKGDVIKQKALESYEDRFDISLERLMYGIKSR